jgi:choline dehydrogenase-like flavoprotein
MNNMANSSGQVGKNFMANVGLQVWGEFEEEVRPNKGIPGALISEDMRRLKNVDFASGYLIQSIGVMPVTYASQLARAGGFWGEELRKKLLAFNHVAGINMHGECLPDENNYLELSDELDEMGLPKPRIYFTAGENEKKMSAHGDKIMREIWSEAGAENLLSYHRKAHTIGTCRMGSSGDTAVVDGAGRSFDVANLYICDNSVFPSTLAVNPALTIMALSLRTADLFLSQKS